MIKRFNSIFGRHGILEAVVADNLPFNSFEIRIFAIEYGIQIHISIPEYSKAMHLRNHY